MKTTMLAQRSVDNVGAVQTGRKLLLLLTVAMVATLFVFGASRLPYPLRETFAWVGLGLIIVCIIGRTWCALYIGGRKTTRLVTTGPYSVCRNPLYLFSIIGAVGVGAQFGAFSVAIIPGLCAWIVHVRAVLQEERLLLATHGDAYRDYLARVPRFVPRVRLWHNVEVLEVRPREVVTTFFDACFFLAAVPIAAAFEHFQAVGYVPVVLWLP